jgi:hypothetical protein
MTEEEEEGGIENIKDPDDYTQRRRIKQILDSRKNAKQLLIQGQAQYETIVERDMIYSLVVRNYVLDIEPLRQNFPSAEDRWESEEIGYVDFENSAETAIGEGTVISAEPEGFGLYGLSDYLETEDIYEIEVEVEKEKQGPYSGRELQEEIVQVGLPTRISNQAFRLANLWLSDIGLSVEPDRGSDGIEL